MVSWLLDWKTSCLSLGTWMSVVLELVRVSCLKCVQGLMGLMEELGRHVRNVEHREYKLYDNQRRDFLRSLKENDRVLWLTVLKLYFTISFCVLYCSFCFSYAFSIRPSALLKMASYFWSCLWHKPWCWWLTGKLYLQHFNIWHCIFDNRIQSLHGAAPFILLGTQLALLPEDCWGNGEN